MDDYSNPPSVASVASVGYGSKQAKTVLRIEKSKKGQIDVKAGQKIWDVIPVDIRDDVSMYMDMDGDHSDGGGKGDAVYHEVKEFCELKSEPNVKRMRSTIPKAVLLLFHTDQVIEGREKIRDMWIPAKRPQEWPSNVPFVDPNNGNKLAKTELVKVFDFLKTHFKKHDKEVHRALGLDMQRATQQSPGQQKAITQVKRAVREIEHLVKKPTLASDVHQALGELRRFLEDIHITDDKDVLRVFDTASSVQRLTLELEVTDKSAADVCADCRIIRGRYVQQEDKCLAQPTSIDVGQQYIGSMESSYMPAAPTPLDTLDTKPDVDAIYKDDKPFTYSDAAPGFTMLTSTSAALDTTTTSPQLGLTDQSPFFAVDCQLEETDILTQICKDLQLDDYHLPQKKMKSEHDVPEMDLSNTMLNAISIQELGSSTIDNSEQQILYHLTSNPIIQTVLDQYQQSEKKEVANVEMGPNPNLQVTSFSWGKDYFAQPTSPCTQIMAADTPSTMIPTMVEGMEYE